MTLLDDGLRALTAPREDGGGAGLVLGALAAAAGLAVLGAAVRRAEGSVSLEEFEERVRNLPRLDITDAERHWIDDFRGDENVGVMYARGWWDHVERLANPFVDAMVPPEDKAARAELREKLRQDPETRAVFVDWLMEQGDPKGEALALLMAKQPHILCIAAPNLNSRWEPDRERTVCWRYKEPRVMDQHELAAAARALVQLYGLDPSVVPNHPCGPQAATTPEERQRFARAWETVARIDPGDDREPRGCGPSGPGRYYYRDLAVTLPIAGKKLKKKRR